MNAFDTNIVVRILVDDDPKQSARARDAAAAGGFVSKTVVLETFWVLESIYGLKHDLILSALLELAALPGVEIEDVVGLGQAVRLTQAGLDFEDAYHFAGARRSTAFLTYDRSLVRRASRLGVTPPVRMP